MKKTITIIEEKTNESNNQTQSKQIKNVAGYARVSTEKDEQFSSYSSQIEYYTNYINSNKNYKLVKIYTDEGISGTSLKLRTGFNEMIKDALDGKIDLIITKSISRFARNTVDSLTTIRKLKEHNVEVFFEKENIYTLDSKGEFLITILSSLAQEESRSISENVKWGIRKKLSDGIYTIHSKEFLGYDVINGRISINIKESYIIKFIYNSFLFGLSLTYITNLLNELKLPTPMNKTTWHRSVVKSILTNEKYIGDALLQKTYSTDFLTKKRIKNNGEIKSYYVTNGHEGIISRLDFKKVNSVINNLSLNKNYLFDNKSNKLSKLFKCSICGHYYIKSKDRKDIIYRCNGKYKEYIKCPSVRYKNNELKNIFDNLINKLLNEKELIESCIKSISISNNKIDYLLKAINNLIDYNKDENNETIDNVILKLNKALDKIYIINNLKNEIKTDYGHVIKIIQKEEIYYHFIDYILVDGKNYVIILRNRQKFIYTIYSNVK